MATREDLPARLRRRLRPAVRRVLERVHVTSRLRRDAAVYELTPPRTGRRGRPRKKGDRLPSLADLAATATGWRSVTFDQRGTQIVRQVWSRQLLWYHVTKDTPLLLAIVRDPDGHQPDDYTPAPRGSSSC